MDNEILFTERQRFKQWWLWLILLGINGLFIFGVFYQVIGSQHFGDKPIISIGYLFSTGLILLMTILFLIFRLDTLIKKDGIYVRFFPFHLSFRHYSWNIISRTYIRQYNPIGEFGGWGLRGFKKNKALNVSGNKGLQIEFIDNKKLLIGTIKPDEITLILDKLGQIK